MWDLIYRGSVVFSNEDLSIVHAEAEKRGLVEMRHDGEWYFVSGADCRERGRERRLGWWRRFILRRR